MGICMTANNHKLDRRIREEVFGSSVVLCFGKIDSTVSTCFGGGGVGGSFCALEEGVDFEIWVGEDVWEVEEAG